MKLHVPIVSLAILFVIANTQLSGDASAQSAVAVTGVPGAVVVEPAPIVPHFHYRPVNVVEAPLVAGQPMLGVVIQDALLGVEVTSVIKGSAGDRVGLNEGDKIVEIDRGEIEVPVDVQLAFARHPLGVPMRLVALRHNRRIVRFIRFVPPPTPSAVQLRTDGAVAKSRGAPSEVERLRSQIDALTQEVVTLKGAVEVLAKEQTEAYRLPPPPASDAASMDNDETSGEPTVP